MPTKSSHCEVLIIGAGPAGLFLAGELHRQGVDCRLIDKLDGPCDQARATVIHPRSLEIFDQVGLLDSFLATGVPLRGLKMFAEGNRLVDQGSLTDVESPFPFDLSLQQSRTERLLIEHLDRCGQPIERGNELLSFEQNNDCVRAVLRHSNGAEETVEAAYLVGCDGAHSTVRHQLGMHLEGADYPATYVVSDVRIDGPLEAADDVYLYGTTNSGAYLGPLPEGRWLFSCDLPDDHPTPAPGSSPSPEELQAGLDRTGPGGLAIRDVAWSSYFHCHKRLVPRYRVGRVFLAGDAAHVQSPAAGQGMNTGIQDGFNLAWKLALELRGEASRSLLDSYHAERHYIGRQMIELSDEAHRNMFDHHPSLGRRLGQWFAAALARYHLRHARLRTTDEVGVSYHHSPIVHDHEPKRGGAAWRAAPQAGERAPDVQLTVHPEDRQTRLFELIREPRHCLLVLEGDSNRQPNALHGIANEIAARYRGSIAPLVTLRETPQADRPDLLDAAGDLHRRYGAEHPCLYLIRPDGYIGFRSPMLDEAALLRYLTRIFVDR